MEEKRNRGRRKKGGRRGGKTNNSGGRTSGDLLAVMKLVLLVDRKLVERRDRDSVLAMAANIPMVFRCKTAITQGAVAERQVLGDTLDYL